MIAAGDTVQFYRQLGDFSANEWTLKYVIRSTRNVYKFTATNDSGLFYINLASTVTALWVPDLYAIGAYVENASSEQKQVRTSFPNLKVLANLATAPKGNDPTPWCVKALASVEETILALTSRTVQTASVNGNAYTLSNIADLYKLRARLRSEVRQIEEQERLNAGLGASNRIGVRFRSVGDSAWTPGYQAPWQ